MTVYVERSGGVVIGVYLNPQPGRAEEGLADDHPDVGAYYAPQPSIDDVRIERERRLAFGFNYDFGDGRGVHHIGTTDADMIGWDEVTKAAQALMALGQSAQPLNIVTETGAVVVSAVEWMQIILAATAVRQPIWAASFALQAMNPIPADYAADHRWP